MQNRQWIVFKYSRVAVFFVMMFLLNLPAFGQMPKWFVRIKQIKLFETTRNDVEKLFDNPKITNSLRGSAGMSVDYKLNVGGLSITYSNGQCSKSTIYDYAVAADVVTSIELFLDSPVDIARLGLNIKHFEKVAIGDVEGLFNYSNESQGIYFVGDVRRLHELEITPTPEQEKLFCQNVKSGL